MNFQCMSRLLCDGWCRYQVSAVLVLLECRSCMLWRMSKQSNCWRCHTFSWCSSDGWSEYSWWWIEHLLDLDDAELWVLGKRSSKRKEHIPYTWPEPCGALWMASLCGVSGCVKGHLYILCPCHLLIVLLLVWMGSDSLADGEQRVISNWWPCPCLAWCYEGSWACFWPNAMWVHGAQNLVEDFRGHFIQIPDGCHTGNGWIWDNDSLSMTVWMSMTVKAYWFN